MSALLATACGGAKGFLWPHDFWVIVTVVLTVTACFTIAYWPRKGVGAGGSAGDARPDAINTTEQEES